MRFKLQSLAVNKCPNVWNDMLKAGRHSPGAGYVDVPDDIARQILNNCGNIPPAEKPSPVHVLTGIEPIPYEDWPAPFKALIPFAIPQDVGLGDTIERHVGPIGGRLFAKWFFETFNRSCGCDTRREKWNIQYPLSLVL